MSVLAELRMEREFEHKALKSTSVEGRGAIEKKIFEQYDAWLDRCEFGHRWLQIEAIAQIVATKMQAFDGDRYRLLAYCIMPNHVHLLLDSLLHKEASHRGKSARYPVTDTLRLLKGSTARDCNLELGRGGSFWQHESYDHAVRDEQELDKTILYILNNPVKAGLVKEWKDWPFTYLMPGFGNW